MSPQMDLAELPEGIFSVLDTDLYKLTMQCAVLKYLPNIRECSILFWLGLYSKNPEVTYAFTNRTPDMRLSRVGYQWIKKQISST